MRFVTPNFPIFFFFNDTATTEIYTLSLHDALPILRDFRGQWVVLYFYPKDFTSGCTKEARNFQQDRKSTRLNSSHGYISYAVFCLKKKKISRSHAAMFTPTP